MILDSKIYENGYCSLILDKAKNNEMELNEWVIDHNTDRKLNGEIYKSPINLYLKNGF